MEGRTIPSAPACQSRETGVRAGHGVRAALACVVLALLGAPGGEARAEKSPHDAAYRLPWPEGRAQRFLHAKGINPHFQKRDLHAVDIDLPQGTEVLAARAGVVEAAVDVFGRGADEEAPATFEGNYVRVRHADDTYGTYAHLAQGGVRVRPGERVAEGQLLGYSGASGDVERALLHFGVSRFERGAAGRWEEVSLPVTFTVGLPPIRFEPYTGMIATPAYGGPAVRPHFAYEAARAAPRALTDEEELNAWLRLGLFFLLAVAMMFVSTWLSLGPWRGGETGRRDGAPAP
jgi:murein DD-endopeptidase MepM/ murein hydrolase activator NlpD